jgi:ABC-2 type transport system ATP-binding protein
VGLERRCHDCDLDLTKAVSYTRIVEPRRGPPKRIHVCANCYFTKVSEVERVEYRREAPSPTSDTPARVREGQGERGTGSRAPQPGSSPPRRSPPSSPPRNAVIAATDLAKTDADGTKAVRGVTFEVRRGEIFGVLGPNGAGKSTLIGMLGTLIRPTGGHAVVDGIDVTKDRNAVRARIGFAMQEAGVDDLATGREFLVLQARLYGIDKRTALARADELLALFELTNAVDRRIGSYSGGMKRRIDLAAALIHRPPILFLDEPTEGLDPRSRQGLWQTIKRLRSELGATVLLSTHYMEEADKLCDRIAIIDEGRIVVHGTPDQLKAMLGGEAIVLDYGTNATPEVLAGAEQIVRSTGVSENVQRTGAEVHAYVADPAHAAPQLLRALDQARMPPPSLRIQRASLDDVYLRFTGRRIEEAEKKEADP